MIHMIQPVVLENQAHTRPWDGVNLHKAVVLSAASSMPFTRQVTFPERLDAASMAREI